MKGEAKSICLPNDYVKVNCAGYASAFVQRFKFSVHFFLMHFCEKAKIENVKCMMLQYFALLYLVEYFTFEQKLILFVLKLQTSQEKLKELDIKAYLSRAAGAILKERLSGKNFYFGEKSFFSIS